MKQSWIILSVALFSCTSTNMRNLSTPASKEASLTEIKTPYYNPIVLGSFIVPRTIDNDKNVPWVNVYLLETEKKDTIAILDTRFGEVGFDLNTITPWIELAEAKRLEICKVNATEKDVIKIRRYKYKYCLVTFAIDN